MKPAQRILAALSAAVLLGACGTAVVNPVTGKTERTVMDEKAEIEEGRKAHEEIVKEYGVVQNPRLQGYVNDLGQKLAKQSHRAHLKWTFTVLDSPEVNAFALPGGYVYVTRGILPYLDSEAELAGVIGHEIGHVTARHGAQRATSQQRAGIGVLAATILGAVLESQGVTGAGEAASNISQSVAAGYIASYSREQELQADELGAEYLARNQYNPQNMVDVIGALKAQERYAADVAKAEGKEAPGGANWLSSHPSNDQRLDEIKQIAAKYKGNYSEDGRSRYLQAIDGVAFGESADQGLTRGSNFYHEDLGIALTAPAGWKIENSPNAILLVNGAGDAALIVKLVSPKVGATHEAIIKTALKPVDGKTETRQINGLAATHFAGTVRNAKGQQSNVQLTLVTGPKGQNYSLQYAARDAATLQRNLAGLSTAETSFRALTAADLKAAQPWKIDIVPYPAGGFAELAKRSPLSTKAEQQLRLINGVYNSGATPAVGQKVKVVR